MVCLCVCAPLILGASVSEIGQGTRKVWYGCLIFFRSFRPGTCQALPGIYNSGTVKDPAGK